MGYLKHNNKEFHNKKKYNKSKQMLVWVYEKYSTKQEKVEQHHKTIWLILMKVTPQAQ